MRAGRADGPVDGLLDGLAVVQPAGDVVQGGALVVGQVGPGDASADVLGEVGGGGDGFDAEEGGGDVGAGGLVEVEGLGAVSRLS